MDNVITAVGALGRDPEVRYTQGGRAVCNFRMATTHRFQRNNEWQEETTWLAVATWGSLAENIAASCQKGTRVLVTGRMSERETTDDDGNKKKLLELQADDVAVSLRWNTAEVERNQRKDDR